MARNSKLPVKDDGFIQAEAPPSVYELEAAKAFQQVAECDGGFVALLEIMKRAKPDAFVDRYLAWALPILARHERSAQSHTRLPAAISPIRPGIVVDVPPADG